MGIGWLILCLFGGALVFFFVLGRMTWGTGADLVDWDPIGRQNERMLTDDEDIADLLEITNRRRRASGLPELGQHDVLAEIARRRKSDAP